MEGGDQKCDDNQAVGRWTLVGTTALVTGGTKGIGYRHLSSYICSSTSQHKQVHTEIWSLMPAEIKELMSILL